MSSTDTLGRLHRICTRWRSLTGWLHRVCMSMVPNHSPPMEGRCLVQMHWGDCIASAPGNSPPVEGWQAEPGGVVVSYLHPAIPLLWRGDV